MKLLKEDIQDIEYLIESNDDGKKSTFIKGVFMQSEKPNRNRRTYPKRIMEREVSKFQKLIDENRAMGELGHPASPTVNLNQVSHLITNLTFEGNDVMGKARILENTPMGKIAKALIDEKIKLGVSSRGVGSLKSKGGINEVQDDFNLATIDIVSDPSGIDCWVDGIMEGAEWVLDASGNWVMIESIQEEIKNTNSKDLLNKKLELFEKFIKSIR